MILSQELICIVNVMVNEEIAVISRDRLAIMKTLSGRAKDLADL